MTLVWRVEDLADGGGPYIQHERRHGMLARRIKDAIFEMSIAHSRDFYGGVDRHPAPNGEADLGYAILEHEVCGFLKASDLREWFGGWGVVLDNAGYEVVVYDVPDRKIRVGKHQIVFDKGERRPLESFKTTTIIGG